MGFVLLRCVHPSRLTMQLPQEVAEMIGLSLDAARSRPGHSVSFLRRGPGIARLVASGSLREALAIEVLHDRFLASTRPGEKYLFSVPAALLRHLEMEVGIRGERLGRGTDDRILFLVPEDEYHDACAAKAEGVAWAGPRTGGMAHMYAVKGVFPLPRGLAQLAELERRIEEEEWRPAVAALQKVRRIR